jgi:hypothetical protein
LLQGRKPGSVVWGAVGIAFAESVGLSVFRIQLGGRPKHTTLEEDMSAHLFWTIKACTDGFANDT